MYDSILVPTDGSDAAERAAAHAFDLAREVGATVHVIYVIDESAANLLLSTESMGSVLEALSEEGEHATDALVERAPAGVELVVDVVRGMHVYEAIVDYATAHGIDLIVMGTYGRRGFEHLLGSTTERVLAASPIPVLTVSLAAEADSSDEE